LKSVILLFEFLYIEQDTTLQKQLEYVHRAFLVDTQWVEDHLRDPKASIAEVDYDSGSRIEMKKERIKKTSTVLFAIVTVTALITVSLIPASQQASAVVVHHKVAVHHKAHTASSQASAVVVHHKVAVHHRAHTASKGKISVHQIAVIPEAHGKPDVVLQNATALKALVKGPYGETDVIGGMMSGGY
jgi:hypothetical protein